MIFEILKNRNRCESPIHQEASNKISSKSDAKQRSYSNFDNGVKSRDFRKFLLPGPPTFDFFRLFIVILNVHDERNRMAFVSLKSAGWFSRSEGGESAPHQLTHSRKSTSNRVFVKACYARVCLKSNDKYPKNALQTV